MILLVVINFELLVSKSTMTAKYGIDTFRKDKFNSNATWNNRFIT